MIICGIAVNGPSPHAGIFASRQARRAGLSWHCVATTQPVGPTNNIRVGSWLPPCRGPRYDQGWRCLSEELRTLNDEYATAESRLRELDADLDRETEIPSERDVTAALRTIDPLWEELFPAENERIVHLLVESAVVRPDGLTIRLRPMGLMNLAAELAPE